MSVVVAILAKNKELFLDLYLRCIFNQTYDKKKIHLYIRTNDNTDNTQEILARFVNSHGSKYASVYYNDDDISEKLKTWGEHEWNAERFKILGEIRQRSIDYAKRLGAHYFTVDCDNFIIPETLHKMYRLRDLGVISPMLRTMQHYSNFHYDVDARGYYKEHPEYFQIRYRQKIGVYTPKVVHCVYFIRNELLGDICYFDNSNRHEYVIFSDTLRKKGIEQYLDNTLEYGIISFSKNQEELDTLLKDTNFTIN